MTSALYWLCGVLGFGVVVARRRSLAVALVTAQTLLLAGLALDASGNIAQRLGTTVALTARAAALATVLLLVVSRTRESLPVRAGLPALTRAALAVALALLLTALVPVVGLGRPQAEDATLAIVACGLVATATRRSTILQIAGLVVIENGLVLAALAIPGGAGTVIELGAGLDLMLIALVAVAFHERIFAEFGAGDTARLGSLRD